MAHLIGSPWVWDLTNPTKATGAFPNRLEGAPPLAPGAGWFAGVAGQVQLAGRHRLQVGGLAVAIEFGNHRCWPQAPPLVEQEPQHRVSAQGFDMAGGIEVAVVAQEHIALGIDRLEHVSAVAAGGEPEL